MPYMLPMEVFGVNLEMYILNLNGKNYWSAVMLPQNNTNTNSLASSYKKYAYVFPENTEASWIYNESNSSLKTQFNVSVSVKEGSNNILQVYYRTN